MDWSSLIPTLVGAGLSILTTAIVFTLTQNASRNRDKAEFKREAAQNAYVGLQKLMCTANCILGLKKHFDAEFESAREQGLETEEPAHIIRQVVGDSGTVEAVTAVESSFLAELKQFELISNIWQIESRARSSIKSADSINILKKEYDDFLMAVGAHARLHEGAVANIQLEGDNARVAHMHISKLNSVIGPLLQHLEEDSESVKVVVNDYVKAAKEHFGDKFPMTDVKWMD